MVDKVAAYWSGKKTEMRIMIKKVVTKQANFISITELWKRSDDTTFKQREILFTQLGEKI